MFKFDATQFHSNSWSFIGADCQLIQDWVFQLVNSKLLDFHCSFIDANHGDEGTLRNNLNTDVLVFESKEELKISSKFNPLVLRNALNSAETLLVNGNHYHADKQIVFIQAKKYASLKKKLSRLTSIQAVVFIDLETIHDYLEESIDTGVPRFTLNQAKEFARWFNDQYNLAPLSGLVLNGGNSSRMGFPKGEIEIMGKPMWKFAYESLRRHTSEVFISVKEQFDTDGIPVLEDQFLNMGVAGALITAFHRFPNRAFLVVPNDNPSLSDRLFQQLISSRQKGADAVVAVNPTNNEVQPLLAIWEPRSQWALYSAMLSKEFKLLSILETLNVVKVEVDEKFLLNINTPEQLKAIKLNEK